MPEEWINCDIQGIIGEGVAASTNPVLGWVGSLNKLEPGKAYWIKVDSACEFNFECPSD